MLNDVEEAIRSVSERAGASVVSVGRNGRGTGFVVTADRVLTSAHNLRDDTTSVTFADSSNAQANVHGVDTDGDLAVLAVPTGTAPVLTFADVMPAVGAAVFAVSRGGHRPRTTVGFVSSVDQSFRGPRGRVVRGSVEHTAPLARGSSGGPILDAAGNVVGVNTHRAGDGFYFARAADDLLKSRVQELIEGRSPRRRTLGVALAPQHVAKQLREAVGLPAHDGLLVRGVEDNGPAARAGIVVGDLLVSFAGRTLASVDDLQEALEQLDAESADVGFVRGVDTLSVTVEFETPTAE